VINFQTTHVSRLKRKNDARLKVFTVIKIQVVIVVVVVFWVETPCSDVVRYQRFHHGVTTQKTRI
jgi:hypothetical protein